MFLCLFIITVISRPKFVRLSPSPSKVTLKTDDLTIKGVNILPTKKPLVPTQDYFVPTLKKKKKKAKKQKQPKEEEAFNLDLEYKIIQPLKPPKYNFLNQMKPRTVEEVEVMERLSNSGIQDVSNIKSPVEEYSSMKKESFKLVAKTEVKEVDVFSRVAKRINNELRFVNTMLEPTKSRPKTAFKKTTKNNGREKATESHKEEGEEEEIQLKERIPVDDFRSQTASELYELTKNLLAEVAV